jgi:hypothetical protein
MGGEGRALRMGIGASKLPKLRNALISLPLKFNLCKLNFLKLLFGCIHFVYAKLNILYMRYTLSGL